MKSFKPMPGDAAVLYIDDNMYVDIEYLEQYRKNPRSYWDVIGYHGLVLGFGKTVFVYDVESCEILEKEER